MTLSLYVDTDRWRTHQRTLLAEFPHLVPVAKGNGYGFGNLRLAREAALLGAGALAVGTAAEAAEVLGEPEEAGGYQGDVLVLTPYRIGEEAPGLPAERVVRTVGHVEALRALAGHRVVVECRTSMRRHGIASGELAHLAEAAGRGGAVLEGFALHLPLDRPRGSSRPKRAKSADPVTEVAGWVAAIAAAGLPAATVYLSHLSSAGIGALAERYPGTEFRSRIGTRLWLGDVGSLTARATVLDVTAVSRGERYGYRQHRAPSDGHLLVLAGGTAHGIGMAAPKYVHGLLPRAKELARAGLATVNRTLSPYQWNGRQLWFAEPPHMQVSIVFLPGGDKPPAVGDELPVNVRHTTTHFDQVTDRPG
ncbi:alanine racemase [Kitasatospora sp. NBC_01287]|uniref:alanine racemase n=1 Tax=Kitasatospora sp. NBC_01287 TaxID=2903573 RepID=UPI00224D0D9B|nr:alanine racemase [Kitasatospora sp. NBC_01287]MCX4747648.1 alanine racemase [Kitasatospora sp. NBC_01287]